MDSAPDLPIRLRDDGRTATWNPATTRAVHVMLHVERGDGTIEERKTINSGRARVRDGERIVRITPGGS